MATINASHCSSVSISDHDRGCGETTALTSVPAAAAQAKLIARLAQGLRVFDRLDYWSVGEWVHSDAWAFHRDAALLVVPLDIASHDSLDRTRASVAWVRWCAVGAGQPPSSSLRRLFGEAERRLTMHGVREVWCIVRSSDWLRLYLRDLGYWNVDRIFTFKASPARLVEAARPRDDLVIRPAALADLAAVCALDAQVFAEPWRFPPALMTCMMTQAFSFTLAVRGGEIVGYSCASLFEGDGHVVRLAVHAAHRRQGIGAALLADCAARMMRAGVNLVTLNTQGSNRDAQRFYRRLGFALLGEKPAVVRKCIAGNAGGE